LDFAVGGVQMKAKFWDTAGDQKYQVLNKNFYKGAHGAIIVWDLTGEFNLQRLEKWIEDAREEAAENISIVIVGNKVDLPPNEETVKKLRDFVHYKDFKYFEASARTGENVSQVFEEILVQVKNTHFHGRAFLTESIVLKKQSDEQDHLNKQKKCEC
jgi:small GTP-binding protein